MKKLFQICLIVVLVFVLFQAVAGSAAMASGQMDPEAASNNSFATSTSVEGAHASACLIRVKGLPCVIPNVGWNS